jgi:WD40 repeat protein
MVKESQAHLKSINDILIIDDKNLILTAGSDGVVKIYELTTLKLLKKLSFKVDINEKSNYSMRGMKYDKYGGFLYTIQAPMRGRTYLTKWDGKNNFTPVNTLEVSDTICTSIDYSPLYDLIGLSDCKGSLIYVDASKNMNRLKEVYLSEITIKSVAFKNGNLVSGAADNALQLNYIYKPNLVSFTFLMKLFVFVLVAYYMYNKIMRK